MLPVVIVVWMIKQPVIGGIGNPKLQNLSTADAQRLKTDVEKLSVVYAKRNFLDVKTLNSTANYIQTEFQKSTKRVDIQTYQVDSEKFHNVIAHFGPDVDYTATYENGSPKPIIIGAHYDAHEETMGADDNASGVAGLLELARIFAEKPPSVPVQIVAYTLEEPPNFRTDSMGSRQHAASLVRTGVQPALVIVLEMIGYYDTADNSQKYPVNLLQWFYPTRADFIAVVGNLTDTSMTKKVKMAMQAAHPEFLVESINTPAIMTGVDFSDHASYWLHDMPAVMVTDTSFYRNQHYHQPTDTADTLDYARMAKVVDGVYAAVNDISQPD
jgi:hypothetical protein